MGTLRMSDKERRRKTVFEKVRSQGLTLQAASKLLGLSYRQTRRSYKRFLAEGDAGLVHRNRGRPSNRAKPAWFHEKVLERYRKRYRRCGPTFAAEKLRKEGLDVDHETLRRWLLDANLTPRQRKGRKHRQRRPRKKHFGELVQMDGSIHDWFGPDEKKTCLMKLIDDATNTRLALMDTQETTVVAMLSLWRWIEKYGIPQSLYTDRKSVYITDRDPTMDEQLAGQEPLTAFGKACAKLNITIIPARSPQAKGRVERSHGLYQDRFMKELDLQGVTTVEGANEILLNGFTEDINDRFSVEPASNVDFHLPVPKEMNLADVFCFEETRVVQNDWTIRYKNCWYQIEKGNRPRPRPKDKVLVRTRLDTTVHFLYRDKPLKVTPISEGEREARHEAAKTEAASSATPQTPREPRKPTNSPWRQNCTLMFADTKDKKK